MPVLLLVVGGDTISYTTVEWF